MHAFPNLAFIKDCIFSMSIIFRDRRVLVVAILLLLGTCLELAAQNVVLSGDLSGRVTDETRAVVPTASVTLRNLATGVEQSAPTNHVGFYHFSALMPGTYSVTASLDGFRDVVALVRIIVGNTTIQDIELQVGARGDTSTVTAILPLIRPAESSTSTVLDHSLIDELPLNGRKYTDFVALTPNTGQRLSWWLLNRAANEYSLC